MRKNTAWVAQLKLSRSFYFVLLQGNYSTQKWQHVVCENEAIYTLTLLYSKGHALQFPSQPCECYRHNQLYSFDKLVLLKNFVQRSVKFCSKQVCNIYNCVNQTLNAYLPRFGLATLQSNTSSFYGNDVNVQCFCAYMIITRGKCSVSQLWGLFFKNDTLEDVRTSSTLPKTCMHNKKNETR